MNATFENEKYKLFHGECLKVLKTIESCSVDSIVTDPPYELGFMGKKWDSTGISNSVEMWSECFRVLKPGGHLLSFSGSRTYHRMTCAIEDAGFDIRDQIMWVYGSGFPKSLDVSKAIDKAAGAEREVIGIAGKSGSVRNSISGNFTGGECMTIAASTDAAKQWQGWGTALKPAHEPICVARKPLSESTVAANVVKFGTGSLNIDGCRVETTGERLGGGGEKRATFESSDGWSRPWMSDDEKVKKHAEKITANVEKASSLGRWPANLIHDGSPEVLSLFPQTTSGKPGVKTGGNNGSAYGVESRAPGTQMSGFGDSVSAARFFYCPKTSKTDRHSGMDSPGNQFTHGGTLRKVENTETVGNNHPTVKPHSLMAYLCRLVTPPAGIVLDPFMGSGSTGKAAISEGFRFIGIERELEYLNISVARISQIVEPDTKHELQSTDESLDIFSLS